MGEVAASLSRSSPPARALSQCDGAPTLMRWSGDGYAPDRPASSGDAAPVLLADEDALTAVFTVEGDAALHGRDAARIEAARRSPFPLEGALWALERAPGAWEGGAVWRLAAAPAARVEAMRAALVATGARPGDPFALADGAAIPVRPGGRARRGLLVPAAAICAVLAALGAMVSIELGASRMTDAAEARVAEARRTLAAAETAAAEAEQAREAASLPIRQARAADAMLKAAPAAGAALAALTDAAPDDAHVRRVAIRPEVIEGEFLSPDAAALARSLATSPAFARAEVDGAARTDAQSGLQRATLRIEPAEGG